MTSRLGIGVCLVLLAGLLEPPGAHHTAGRRAQPTAATYDDQTFQVMARVLTKGSSCVDVGSYKGEILRRMVELAPEGTHYAFEPIPRLARELMARFARARVKVFEMALGDHEGSVPFNLVVTNEAYSGLERRQYERADERVKVIQVRLDTLDHVIPKTAEIAFVKIDVEGAELQVLRGAREVIGRSAPVIVFEHGLGGADFYGTKPGDVYRLLREELGLQVSLVSRWLDGDPPLSRAEFERQFQQRVNYYFIAYRARHEPRRD